MTCLTKLFFFFLAGPITSFVLAADPFLNDQNFVLSVLSLEELGATGNKVSEKCIVFCIGLSIASLDRLLLVSVSVSINRPACLHVLSSAALIQCVRVPGLSANIPTC